MPTLEGPDGSSAHVLAVLGKLGPAFAPLEARVDALVAIHTVDWEACGLGDLAHIFGQLGIASEGMDQLGVVHTEEVLDQATESSATGRASRDSRAAASLR